MVMTQLRDGSFLLVVVFLLAACVEEADPWPALEVQSCVDQAVTASFSADVKERARAKALAVQAVNLAGDNARLVAAANLAAGWAEWMRGERRLGLRFVRKAVEGLEPSKETNALVLWLARSHKEAKGIDEGLEILNGWISRLDTEVHAHLLRPLKALRREMETAQAPATRQSPVINLQDLIKR